MISVRGAGFEYLADLAEGAIGDVWAYCTLHVYEHGEMPTGVQIADALGLSVTTIQKRLNKLEVVGAVEHVPGRRGVRRLDVWLVDVRPERKTL